MSSGPIPASATASRATLTISDSTSSASCLPNGVWLQPTMHALIRGSSRWSTDPWRGAPSPWPRSVRELVPRATFGEFGTVTGTEFIRRLRRLARKRGVAFDMDTRQGRGSHRIVYFGARRTTVKDLKEEIGKGLLRQMCNDLEIEPSDLT